jgi:hypothetical protein
MKRDVNHVHLFECSPLCENPVLLKQKRQIINVVHKLRLRLKRLRLRLGVFEPMDNITNNIHVKNFFVRYKLLYLCSKFSSLLWF